MYNKRAVISGYLLFLLLFLASWVCVAARNEPVTIRFAYATGTGNRDPIDVIQQIVSGFGSSHPNIRVEVENEYAGDHNKLATHAAGGVAADIIEGYNALVPFGIDNGIFLDLMPYITRDGQESLIRDFVPAVMESFKRGNRVYGFPQSSQIGAVCINRDMLDAAGMSTPAAKWDWDAFGNYARKQTIMGADGKVTQSGFGLFTAWLWWFSWFRAAGANFDDPYLLPLDSPPMLHTMQFIQDLKQRGALEWGQGGFLERRTAMTSSGAWELGIWQKTGMSFTIAQMPVGPAGQVTMTNTNIVAINQYTKYPDECWEFLKWWFSRDTQLQYLELLSQQPARMSLGRYWLSNVERFTREKNMPPVQGLDNFALGSAYAEPQPFFADPTVVTRYIEPAVRSILVDNEAPQSVLSSAAEAGTAFLQQAK